jgi:hypothetical protein
VILNSATMEPPRLSQPDLTFHEVFDNDDDEEIKEAQTVHHIRANSSIMKVKKILGEYATTLAQLQHTNCAIKLAHRLSIVAWALC